MKLLLATAAIFIVLPSSITGSLLPYEPEALESYSEDCSESNLTISFANIPLTSIRAGFISSPVLTCINIQNNEIQKVQEGAFDYVPNLTYLNLQGNKIPIDELFLLGGHMNLRQLILSNQRELWNSYGTSINGRYPQLQYLDLKSNGISKLSTKSYYPMPKLTDLDLSNNSLSDLTIDFSSSVRNLYLHGNRLTQLSVESLYNLTTLTLDDNRISTVSQGRYCYYCLNLKNQKNLKYLSLANNPISSIDSSAFADTVNLKHLNLSNTLKDIKSGTFDSVRSLETLVLDRNSLSTIPTIRSNISTLSLNCNLLTHLRTNNFLYLPNLRKLFLSGNMISYIDAGAFAGQGSLEELHLDGNQLSYLPPGWHQPLKSLQYLDLSRNNFTSLVPVFYSKDSPVRELYFNHNPIGPFYANISESLPKSVIVHLVDDDSRSNLICK